jgi:predicted transcriptional regulator
MPEVNYTIRVDEDVKDAFLDQARQLNLNGSQLLRNFMAGFVEERQQEGLSAGERDKRRRAVEYGQASTHLEGLAVSERAREMGRRFMGSDAGGGRIVS